MGVTSVPKKPAHFIPGDVMDPSAMNAAFDAAYAELQGNIGTANFQDRSITASSKFVAASVDSVALAQDALGAVGVRAYSNLKILVVNAASTLAVTADSVCVATAAGKIQLLSTLSVTINAATTGTLGRDTGAASIGWWYVYAIAKADGTTSAVISLSATAPTLPTGYTYYARLGAVYMTAVTPTLRGMIQWANYAQYSGAGAGGISVLAAGAATSTTAVNLSTAVPATAGQVLLIVTTSAGPGVVTLGTTKDMSWFALAGGWSNFGQQVELVLDTPQTIWYSLAGGGTVTITVQGWVDR